MVYWLLLALAISTFAACVLLPEWRHLETLAAVEQAEADRADHMDRLVARERRHLAALTSDPAAMVRLAQRELTMVRSGEFVVSITGADASAKLLLFRSGFIEKFGDPAGGGSPTTPHKEAEKLLKQIPAKPFDEAIYLGPTCSSGRTAGACCRSRTSPPPTA